MNLQTLAPVHAMHDLQRGRTVVVKQGSHGKVVDSWPNWVMHDLQRRFQA